MPRNTARNTPLKTMTAAEFRAILEAKEMSQREAARRLGYSRVTVNHWAQGKASISPAATALIEKVLGVRRGS